MSGKFTWFVSRWYKFIFWWYLRGIPVVYHDDTKHIFAVSHGGTYLKFYLSHDDTLVVFWFVSWWYTTWDFILYHHDTLRVLTVFFMLYNNIKIIFWTWIFDNMTFVSSWYKCVRGVVSHDDTKNILRLSHGDTKRRRLPAMCVAASEKEECLMMTQILVAFVFFLPLFKEREDDILHLFLGVVFREVLRNGF